MKAKDLFDLPKSLEVFKEFFDAEAEPWEWLKNIFNYFGSFYCFFAWRNNIFL